MLGSEFPGFSLVSLVVAAQGLRRENEYQIAWLLGESVQLELTPEYQSAGRRLGQFPKRR